MQHFINGFNFTDYLKALEISVSAIILIATADAFHMNNNSEQNYKDCNAIVERILGIKEVISERVSTFN